MAEIIKVQSERPIRQEADKLVHIREAGRFAVWSEPHHLIFVAVVQKPEILCQRLIENPKRVRKIDTLRNRKIGGASKTPCRAGKIPKAVYRYRNRLLERRHVECRR